MSLSLASCLLSAAVLTGANPTPKQLTIPIYYPVTNGFGKAATNVSWGEPLQKPVITTFDTGSSTFWVDGPGSYLVGTNAQNGKQCSYRLIDYGFDVYNYTASTTHTAVVPNQFSTGASYGNAKSIQFLTSINDTMTWTSSHVSLNNQEVGLATNTTTQFQGGNCSTDFPGSGTDVSILGVGPNSTWRSNLLASGRTKTLDWSMWFHKSTDKAPVALFSGAAGLGGPPPTNAYTGGLTNVPLRTDGVNAIFYTVATPKLQVRGREISRISRGTDTVILDSGTSTDMVPFNQTEIIAASGGKLIHYTSTEGFLFFAYNGPCEEMNSELTLDYTFNGTSRNEEATVKVPFKNYALGPVGTSKKESSLCNLNNFRPDNVGMSIFGVPFFTAATFHFQDSQKLVGIAQGGL